MRSPLRVVVRVARGSDVPAGDEWLAGSERTVLQGFAVRARGSDWRLGRWVAKRAVQGLFEGESQPAPALADIEILPATDGAPVALVFGRRTGEVVVSLSHRAGRGFAAATRGQGIALGCDVERLEPRSARFVEDYFTDAERMALSERAAPDRDTAANLLWSAKEATLKATREGLRVDTRAVEVEVPPTLTRGAWVPLKTARHGGRAFVGWWLVASDFVHTVVADRAFELGEV